MTGQDLQAVPPGDVPIHLAWSRTEAPTSPQRIAAPPLTWPKQNEAPIVRFAPPEKAW
jgi:hypothetical protein